MSNPLIDNLNWNPNNPAESWYALLNALTALQIEHAMKIPITAQISRSGRVTADDWGAVDTSREDLSLLHFDNVNREFAGEWGNIVDEIAPVEAKAQPGFSERFEFTVDSDYYLYSGSATPVVLASTTITLVQPAKLFIFFPFLTRYISGTNGSFSIDIEVDSVTSMDHTVLITNTVWNPLFLVWGTDVYSSGSHDIDLVITKSISSGQFEFANIAPLPNTVSSVPLGLVNPYLSYVEAIYV